MSHNALFIGFNRPISHRESEAHEALEAFYGHLEGLQAAGKIDSFEPIMLEHHGGDLNGMCVIRGHRDHIHGFRHTDEWHAAWHDILHHFTDVGIMEAYVGEAHKKRHGHHKKRAQNK